MAAPLFTVDLEDYYHAITDPSTWSRYASRLQEPTEYLLTLCLRHQIHAIFYILGHVAERHPQMIHHIEALGHTLGSHGYYHRHHESRGDTSDRKTRILLPATAHYRSPFFDSTPRPGYGGGAYFRILPYWILRSQVLSSGVFYIHPHDLDPHQPRLPFSPWWRFIGLRTARLKLERLCRDVRFV